MVRDVLDFARHDKRHFKFFVHLLICRPERTPRISHNFTRHVYQWFKLRLRGPPVRAGRALSARLGMTNVAVAHPSSVSFAFTLLKSGTTRASSLQSTYRIIPARSITKVARFGTPLMPSPICGRKDS